MVLIGYRRRCGMRKRLVVYAPHPWNNVPCSSVCGDVLREFGFAIRLLDIGTISLITSLAVAGDDELLDPSEIAEGMLELCEKEEYGDGTILEVLRGKTRVVPLYNADPPSGQGLSISGWNQMQDEYVFLTIIAPFRMMLERCLGNWQQPQFNMLCDPCKGKMQTVAQG